MIGSQPYAALMALTAPGEWGGEEDEESLVRLLRSRPVRHQQITLRQFGMSRRRRLKVTNGPREFSNRRLP